MEEKKPEQQEKSGVVSVHVLAKLFDLTVRRVQQLAQDGIIPSPESKGKYSLAGSVRGYVGFLQNGTSDEDLRSQKVKNEVELLKYKAANERVEYQLKTRELLTSVEVEVGQARSFKLIANMLETLADVLERDAGINTDAVERVIDITDSIRNELYESLIDTKNTDEINVQ